MKTALPPTATPAQILRACCAGPDGKPELMCPFLSVGKAGKTITGATDGETIALWTATKLGPFREWTALTDNGTVSPLLFFRRLCVSVPSHPLALARKSRHGWTIDIGGHLGIISAPHMAILQCLDACYLGRSAAPPDSHGQHPALTLRGTCASVLFIGSIICPIAL